MVSHRLHHWIQFNRAGNDSSVAGQTTVAGFIVPSLMTGYPSDGLGLPDQLHEGRAVPLFVCPKSRLRSLEDTFERCIPTMF